MSQVLPLRHHPLAAFALAGAALADSITFLLLPPGAELNPLAVANPPLAIGAKALLVVALLAWPYRYALTLRLIAATAWSVGALSNLLVLVR